MTLIHLSYSIFFSFTWTLVSVDFITCTGSHIHKHSQRYRTFLSARILMLSFITWKGNILMCLLFPFFFFLLCIWLCWRVWSVATYVESWNTTLFSVEILCGHSSNQPTWERSALKPLLLSAPSSHGQVFKPVSSSSALGFPMQGGWHTVLGRVSSHASHSCLQMKIFPSLKKVRKNLTFLFFAFYF